MNIPDPSVLRKAIAITTEIEKLERKLHNLLSSALETSEPASSSKKESSLENTAQGKPRRGRPPGVAEPVQGLPTDTHAEKEGTQETEEETSCELHGGLSMPAMDPDPMHESMLLVDDSGEEQLAVVPDNEACSIPQPPSVDQNSSDSKQGDMSLFA